MIAFVRSVTAASTSAGSMLRSPSRTSTKTGVAPACTITFAVAGHVIGVVITSSPGPMPRATSARCIAAVPEATASTCFASRYSAIRSSSSAARGPVVSQPERSASATASISSSPIAGGWKPSWVSRVIRRPSSGVEAYFVRGGASALERLVAAGADGDHSAGPVGPAQERPEHVPRLAVEPHVEHALDGVRRLAPLHGPQLPLGRDEKEHARAADETLCFRNTSLLTEREAERQVVQPDPR